MTEVPMLATDKPRTRKRRKPRKVQKADTVGFEGLVDAAFRRKVTLVVSGEKTRASTFEAIVHRLLQRGIAGDPQAFKTWLAYDKFARDGTPATEQEFVVIGDLPRPCG